MSTPEQCRDYYQRNKDKLLARHCARYDAKRDEILAKQREKRRAAKAAEEARNPKPAPKHDFVQLRRDQLGTLFREQRSHLPQCPICGAYRENKCIVRVCTACGSKIIEEEQQHDQI